MTVHLDALRPLADFRREHDLPAEFGVALVEPKAMSGLARIDHAGGALNALRASVLAATPSPLTLDALDTVTQTFERALRDANPQIGLKDVEIEYAVAGFDDVLRAWLYARLRDHTTSFDAIYDGWLAESTRLATTIHTLTYHGVDYRVRTINTAYGRVGLRVEHPGGVDDLADASLACPAAGFMRTLLTEIVRS